MIRSIDEAVAFQSAALKLRGRRQEILASNIANADTPNYKARDFNFAQTLRATMAGGEQSAVKVARTDARHLEAKGSSDWLAGQLRYRIETQPSIDGNTVDVDTEMAQFTENAMRYQAALTFLGRRFEQLSSALRENG